MPRTSREALAPMLAATGTAVPRGPGWTFEPKYDGIRVLAVATPTSVALKSRNGRDKSDQFPEVARAVQALAGRRRRPFVLDGEIVARVGRRIGRFQQVQARINLLNTEGRARAAARAPATLVVFDLLADGATWLVDAPWSARRHRLEELLARQPRDELGVRLARTSRSAPRLLADARRGRWEGIMAKRTDAPYETGRRSPAWLKLKLEHEQEFVVGGYTDPRQTRLYFGALLLGYYDRGGGARGRAVLHYAGLCGGGFTRPELRALYGRLRALTRPTSPFAGAVPRTPEPAHWVEPRLVVEVKFNQWTDDGRLRQPIFLGLRDDKKARDVVREPESLQP